MLQSPWLVHTDRFPLLIFLFDHLEYFPAVPEGMRKAQIHELLLISNPKRVHLKG